MPKATLSRLLAHQPDLIAIIALFAASYSVFILSPVQQPADSLYSMMVSQSLLRHRTFALDDYRFPTLKPVQDKKYTSNTSIYHLELINGHVYYYYGPGSSVLSAPYVALMNALGLDAADASGAHDLNSEMKIQTRLASLLMALLAVLFFLTARLLLPLKWSLVVAVFGAFGTQVWSTATRALWAHTWMIFLLGIVVLMLVAHETKGTRLRPVALATLLSWIFFVRPTAIVPIIVITAYILIYKRELFVTYAITGIAWLAVFFAYSYYNFGQVVPNYYRLGNDLTARALSVGLLGNLISPSRGVLVFVPFLLFVAYLLVRYRRHVSTRLTALALAAIVLNWILVSSFPIWWGGFSFGPRLLTDVVPWFVLLTIVALKAALTAHTKRRGILSGAEFVAGALLLALSIGINGRGAVSEATAYWNVRPQSVDEHPERLWDWHNPQFLAH